MHHAYLIPSKMGGEELKDFILDFLKLQKGKVEWRIFEDNNFKIEMAREVKDAVATRVGGMIRIIVLNFITMNHEAQNTLLKAVEEPRENNIFFLVTSNPLKLLPTINSRIQSVEIVIKDKLSNIEVNELAYSELMKRATSIVEGIKEGKKNKEDALELIDDLIRLARKKKAPPIKLQRLIDLRSYVLDQSSSLKQILESAVIISE